MAAAHTVYNAQQTASRARTFLNYPEGQCLNYYFRCVGGPSTGAYDANAGWRLTTQKVYGGTPPNGAPVYFKGGPHGHWAPSIGGGWIRSTDWPKLGRVSNVEIWRIASAWGMPFVGWGRTYGSVPILGLEAPKPSTGGGSSFKPIASQKGVYTSKLRPGVGNSTSVYNLQNALRRFVGPVNVKAYNPSGATGFYGKETVALVQAAYRIAANNAGGNGGGFAKKDSKGNFQSTATWPGPGLLRLLRVKIEGK